MCEEPNLRLKGVPLIAFSSQSSTAKSNASFSSIFFCNLQVQHKVTPQVHLLLNSFVNSHTSKCTTMCIFKCNSIVTSSAPLISTSNVGIPSDEPSRAPSTALTCSYLSKTSSASSFSLYCASLIAFKENSKAPIQIQQ